MNNCRHKKLVLLNQNNVKLCCRHCHLTIDEEELADGHCPECYEVDGERRRDFKRLEPEDDGGVSYRCEQCGIMIKG